jgi:hypothetical protein
MFPAAERQLLIRFSGFVAIQSDLHRQPILRTMINRSTPPQSSRAPPQPFCRPSPGRRRKVENGPGGTRTPRGFESDQAPR